MDGWICDDPDDFLRLVSHLGHGSSIKFGNSKFEKEDDGHSRSVVTDGPNVEDSQLARWVLVLAHRKFGEKRTLLPAQKRKLDTIGFEWQDYRIGLWT
jgi:hypothetical protein